MGEGGCAKSRVPHSDSALCSLVASSSIRVSWARSTHRLRNTAQQREQSIRSHLGGEWLEASHSEKPKLRGQRRRMDCSSGAAAPGERNDPFVFVVEAVPDP